MHVLLWLNGTPPSQELAASISGTVDSLVVVDGAAHHAKAYGIFPDIVCGDFDSVDSDLAKEWWPNSEVIPLDDQNFTDFEKSLKLILKRGATKCTIIGSFGGWFDHLLSNVALFSEYSNKLDLILRDDGMTGKAISESETLELTTSPNDTISLITLLPEVTVSISGVYWPLNEQKLTRAGNGTSNRATGHSASVTLHQGETLFVIHSSRR